MSVFCLASRQWDKNRIEGIVVAAELDRPHEQFLQGAPARCKASAFSRLFTVARSTFCGFGSRFLKNPNMTDLPQAIANEGTFVGKSNVPWT